MFIMFLGEALLHLLRSADGPWMDGWSKLFTVLRKKDLPRCIQSWTKVLESSTVVHDTTVERDPWYSTVWYSTGSLQYMYVHSH